MFRPCFFSTLSVHTLRSRLYTLSFLDRQNRRRKRQTRSDKDTDGGGWENICNEFPTPSDRIWSDPCDLSSHFIHYQMKYYNQSYACGSICHWTPKPYIIIASQRDRCSTIRNNIAEKGFAIHRWLFRRTYWKQMCWTQI